MKDWDYFCWVAMNRAFLYLGNNVLNTTGQQKVHHELRYLFSCFSYLAVKSLGSFGIDFSRVRISEVEVTN